MHNQNGKEIKKTQTIKINSEDYLVGQTIIEIPFKGQDGKETIYIIKKTDKDVLVCLPN